MAYEDSLSLKERRGIAHTPDSHAQATHLI